jgi:uncharacterized membrane protein YdjX (TVP38/TMEM64 family)
MGGTVKRLSRGRGIGSQVLSIVLLLFFSVVLVNILDINSIRNTEKIFMNHYGSWSLFILLFITVLLYSVAFPSTVLGAASGAALGIVQGVALLVSAVFISSVIVYFASRTFLRQYLKKLIKKNEFLNNLEKVIDSEGFRFISLVRFAPVHATFISALYGVVGIKPGRFFISCLFLLPELILHVYTGYVAASMTGLVDGASWGTSDIVRMIFLAAAIVTVVYLSWIARKTIRRSVR